MTSEEREKKLRAISDRCSQVLKVKIEVRKKTEVLKTESPFENYKQYIPTMMHLFIADIKNVLDDGHYGYRSVTK